MVVGHTVVMSDPSSTLGPTISLAEAVDRCTASRTTIQRKLKAGEIPGASRVAGGGWSIPISGLIAAGMMSRTTPADTPTVSGVDQSAEVELLRVKLAAAEARAAAAEAHRDDLRSIIEDYRRALPPGPMATSETEPTTNPPLTATAAPDGFDAGSGRSLVKALTRRIPRRSRS